MFANLGEERGCEYLLLNFSYILRRGRHVMNLDMDGRRSGSTMIREKGIVWWPSWTKFVGKIPRKPYTLTDLLVKLSREHFYSCVSSILGQFAAQLSHDRCCTTVGHRRLFAANRFVPQIAISVKPTSGPKEQHNPLCRAFKQVVWPSYNYKWLPQAGAKHRPDVIIWRQIKISELGKVRLMSIRVKFSKWCCCRPDSRL